MPNCARRTALTASAPAGSLRKPHPFTGIRVHAAVVDRRRPLHNRARRGQHVTLVVIAVEHHQPAAVLIDLIDELFPIRCNRGLQRGGQHCRAPSRTISSSNGPDAAALSLDDPVS
jgi:hypothetical protein